MAARAVCMYGTVQSVAYVPVVIMLTAGCSMEVVP